MQDVVAACMPQEALGGHLNQGFLKCQLPRAESADNVRKTGLALVRSHYRSMPTVS
jgi:hypothetical protein